MTDTADKPIPADLPAPAPSSVSPAVVASYRAQLTRGEDVVDPHTWAGSVPAATGIAPRVRIGRSRWFNLLWLLPIGFVVRIVAAAAAKGLRGMPSVQRFIERYPGTIESTRPVQHAGLPLWVGAQHFLNLFMMIFIIRSGVQILSDLTTRGCTGPGTARRARPGSGSRSRCPRIRYGRRNRTPSACRDRSVCRGCGTPSGWPAGGTWAWTPCGCSTAWCSTCCSAA